VAALEVAQRAGRLTPDLLALIRGEAQRVRADGETDLADGLDALADHIGGLLAVAQN
jgi:hypothetical protein